MSQLIDNLYNTRREPRPPVGLVRDLLDTPIQDSRLAALWAESRVQALTQKDEVPIPAMEDREGYYNDRHLEYWLSGLDDYRKAIAAADVVHAERFTVLDFGGSTGRVTRHFLNHYPSHRFIISDVNINSVEWVQKYYPKNVLGLLNTSLPTIPLRDNSVDLIVAFSVFTHIDKLEIPWLMELARILKRTGTAYLTVCNEDTWDYLPKNPWLVQLLQSSPEFVKAFDQKTLLSERSAFHYNDQEVYNCNTFFTNAYLKKNWGRVFGSIDIRPLDHGHQTVLVCRNPY